MAEELKPVDATTNTEIDHVTMNEAIDSEASDPGMEVKNIYDMGEFFASMASSYDQKFYTFIIAEYVQKIEELITKKKYKDCDHIFFTVYSILVRGYGEIDWAEDMDIVSYTPSVLLWEAKNNQKTFISASRYLMKILEKYMNKVSKWDTNPQNLAIRNVLEHAFINYIKVVAGTWQDKDMVDAILKWFKFLGIEKEEPKED